MFSEPLVVIARIASVLNTLGIRYLVGGSLASSLYGIPRATQDVDIVADIRLSHVEAFTSALAGDDDVDADMIRASFNVIHLATMFKVDVFIDQGDQWSHEEGRLIGSISTAGRRSSVLRSCCRGRRAGTPRAEFRQKSRCSPSYAVAIPIKTLV